MGEIAAGAAASSASRHCFPAISRGNLNCKLRPKKWGEQTSILGVRLIPLRPSPVPAISSSSSSSSDRKVTYSANVSTDTPFYEPHGVSFAEYLKDRPRIFRAMFPDIRRSQRLNDEEWQIQMLPIQFLLASVKPVVVMRLRSKSGGQGYHPVVVPLHVERVLELQATRWELQGLDALTMPSDFSLNVQGLLYSERNGIGRQSRLKGRLELSISFVLPSMLALVPEDILRSTAELVLKRLVETMKQEVHGGLLADFRSFGRERLLKQAEAAAVASD